MIIIISLAVTTAVSIPNGIDAGELNAIIGAIAAFLIAFQYWSRIGPSQSPDSGYFAIWALAVVYFAFATLVFLIKIEFSRRVFLTGFAVSGLAMIGIQQLKLWLIKPYFAVLPGGRIGQISKTKKADYDFISSEFVEETLAIPAHQGLLKQQFSRVFKNKKINGIVADLHHKHGSDGQRLIVRAVLAGIPVYHFREIDEMYMGRISIDYLTESQFGSSLHYNPYINFKRVVDMILAIIFLPFFLFAIAIAALFILIFDGRPVFFYQNRVGYRGKIFGIWKLRTMRKKEEIIAENLMPGIKKSKKRKLELEQIIAEMDEGQHFITPVGRILRRYRVDELPQIFNVFRGEMSWVGPRAETPELVGAFQQIVRFYNYRHAVLPGVTGWAQVKQGHVTSVDEAREKLRFDLYYLKHFSPWLDFVIIIKTVSVILFGQEKINPDSK